jgi:hypothetical protein
VCSRSGKLGRKAVGRYVLFDRVLCALDDDVRAGYAFGLIGAPGTA